MVRTLTRPGLSHTRLRELLLPLLKRAARDNWLSYQAIHPGSPHCIYFVTAEQQARISAHLQERTMPRSRTIVHRDRMGDTHVFARRVARPGPHSQVALGLDLGTNCGYCYTYFRPGRAFDVEQAFYGIGQWDLSAGNYDSGAIRFVRLRQFLTVLAPRVVFYEESKFTPAVGLGRAGVGAVLGRAMTSAEFLGALKSNLCAWAEESGVPCLAYPIGQIKRHATGRGVADKTEMIKACNMKFGTTLDFETYQTTGVDNMADAAFVLTLGMSEHAAGLGC
jgi:hypothetical protein